MWGWLRLAPIMHPHSQHSCMPSLPPPPPHLIRVGEDDEVILHWTEDGTMHSCSQRELAEKAKED